MGSGLSFIGCFPIREKPAVPTVLKTIMRIYEQAARAIDRAAADQLLVVS